MKNSEIKYNVSKDYDSLFSLLKEGNIIAGFMAVSVNNIPNLEYSLIVSMKYNHYFEIGDLCFDFEKDGFKKICEEYNVRYIPI
jgi:hypothetical protein